MSNNDVGAMGSEDRGNRVGNDGVAQYARAVARLDATIDPAWAPSDRGLAAVRKRAELGLARMREFLTYLGNPHRAFPVVHVGGTAGKGSTSTAIAAMLTASGYRVGLHTSPYLQVATEKLQIDGRLIAADAFASLVENVFAASTDWLAERQRHIPLTYGELWVGLLATWFAHEQVDIAVIEVGAGGRYDLTNVVQPEVSVITSIGLDHTATLGPTLTDIAWHKAGIIKTGAPVVTAVTDPASIAVIRREAAAVAVSVIEVRSGTTYQQTNDASSTDGFREIRSDGSRGPVFQTATHGVTSKINAAVAIAAVRALGDRGIAVADEAIQSGLWRARVPARFEVMPKRGSSETLVDGAHNADKIRALVADVRTLLPAASESPPVVLFGALDSKDPEGMLRPLVHVSRGFVATTAPVRGKTSLSASELARIARRLGASGDIIAEPDSRNALHLARDIAERTGSPLLVTGSLYLAGAVRGWWYPDAAILHQRTAWPLVPSAVSGPSEAPSE